MFNINANKVKSLFVAGAVVMAVAIGQMFGCYRFLHGVCLTVANVGWPRFIEIAICLVGGPVTCLYVLFRTPWFDLHFALFGVFLALLPASALLGYLRMKKNNIPLLVLTTSLWIVSASLMAIYVWG